MVDAGLIVLTAFISPFRAERQLVRNLVGEGEFVEVFGDAPLAVCEERDPQGSTRRRERGNSQLTGIDSAYEAPEQPEIHLLNAGKPVDALVEELLTALRLRVLIDWVGCSYRAVIYEGGAFPPTLRSNYVYSPNSASCISANKFWKIKISIGKIRNVKRADGLTNNNNLPRFSASANSTD